MAEFRTVAKVAEIPPGKMKVVVLDGEEVVIANVAGTYHAFGNICPHEGGPLGEGELAGHTVTCPWHFTVFDVRTGAALEGVTEAPVPTYEIQVAGNEVRARKP